MKKLWLLPLAATLLSVLPALAQDNAALPEEPELDPPAAAGPRQPDLMLVDSRNVGALRTLVPGPGVRAISLGMSRAVLEGDAAAWAALSAWVKGGGTVFLHTDAAQLFGYSTTRPRLGNARVAGQLWGRAKAAIGFGAHPLLLGAASDNDRRALTSAISGVRTVYYQMSRDDVLATAHPAAVPILRVSDLAVSNGAQLYAAAAAPYGQGWAVFTPALVEQDRADGGLFIENLMRFAGATIPGTEGGADQGELAPPPVNLAASLIEEAASNAQRNGFDAAATALKFLQSTRPAAPAPAAAEPAPADAATPEAAPTAAAPADAAPAEAAPAAEKNDELGLPLSRAEFSALLQVLSAARADQPDTLDRAKAAVYILRARLAWQQGDGRAVPQWLGLATDIVGSTAEGGLLAGLAYADASEDRSLPSGQRARLLASAIDAWKQSLGDQPLLRTAGLAAGAAGNGGEEGTVAGVARATIRDWVRTSEFTGRLLAAQPPLVDFVGNGENGIAVRYYEDDPSLRVAVPAAQQLVNFADILGARGDQEELMFFPTPEYYAAYQRIAGFGRQNAPAPGGFVGDAIDGQMLLLSQPSQMILIPSGVPGKPPRPAPFPSAAPNVMGRIHSQVLINQVAGGHTDGEERVPTWMRMGMATYAAKAMAAALGTGDLPNDVLAAQGGFGQLLSPADFQNLGNGAGDNTVADIQAGRLVEYFYNRFGPGAVVETLQRLGAGESVDDALEATTNLTEEQFFMSWYNAETNNRRQ